MLRRLLGAALVALVLLPLHRLLDPERGGLAASTSLRAAEAAWASGWWGAAFVLVAALALGRWVPLAGLPGRLHQLAGWTRQLGEVAWGLATGTAGFLGSSAAALLLFRARPTSVDEMVQLLHARALAEGGLGWPVLGPEAAWAMPNSVIQDGVWSSIYPPGQTLLLAVGSLLDIPWLVGPLATGLAVGLCAVSFRRLLPEAPEAADAMGLLTAASPFLLLLGGTHLSHTGATAATALVLWSALRARDGDPSWALLTGAATGMLVCTRPWIGMVLGIVLPVSLWLSGPKRATATWLRSRFLRWTVGGAPFALLLFTWNQLLYGHPLRLGYAVAFGPSHGLGFHRDPWGNIYGVREALAYTSVDLSLLGGQLLETPFPAVALIGLALAVRPALSPGAGVLLAWAAAAVGANVLYWHHGIHLGPRLLHESAPAWVALAVLAITTLHRAGGSRAWWTGTVRWVGVLGLVGGVVLLPARLASVADSVTSISSVPPPPTPPGPSLVLAHGSWSSRVAARLSQAGVRRDSIETALRRNDLCLVHLHAMARLQGRPAPPLDWTPAPGSPPGLRSVQLSPGNRALRAPDRSPDPACIREARADAVAGTVELTPFLWQAPPDPRREAVLARDLGPEGNGELLVRHPDRTPWFILADGSGGVRLVPYREGMRRIWGIQQDGEPIP